MDDSTFNEAYSAAAAASKLFEQRRLGPARKKHEEAARLLRSKAKTLPSSSLRDLLINYATHHETRAAILARVIKRREEAGASGEAASSGPGSVQASYMIVGSGGKAPPSKGSAPTSSGGGPARRRGDCANCLELENEVDQLSRRNMALIDDKATLYADLNKARQEATKLQESLVTLRHAIADQLNPAAMGVSTEESLRQENENLQRELFHLRDALATMKAQGRDPSNELVMRNRELHRSVAALRSTIEPGRLSTWALQDENHRMEELLQLTAFDGDETPKAESPIGEVPPTPYE
eukprot:m.295749 g.295749  ORF g.295749 m.295749 type:complete len:295 (+) comp13249_c0_seq1:85-969(+)